MRVLYAKVFGGLLMVYLLFSQLVVVKVCAAEWETTTEEKEVQETYQTVFDSMFKELDFEQVEPYAKTYLPQKMSFRTMVQNLCTKNSGENFMQTITDWLWDLFFYELRLVKPFFTQILFLIVIFSCVRPLFLDGSTYVHSLGFLMIYSALASILLQNFLMLAQLAQESMGKMEQYLQALIPSYAAVLLVSGKITTAGIFYEFSFVCLTILHWAMKYMFVPGIHMYLLLRILDQLFAKQSLSKLAEFIEGWMQLFLKTALGLIGGAGIVQSLLTPAKDKLTEHVVLRSMTSLPGIGNLIGTTGNLFLNCGTLLRNSVGIVAVLVLTAIWIGPILKLLMYYWVYRGMAALLQPMADARMVQIMSYTADSCFLYMRVLTTAMLIFFITMVMVTASVSF